MIDRIAPTRRPNGAVVGCQQWRSLLFLHWSVPVETLRELVPERLELDLLEGVAYIGVVPFVMQGVRPSWWPARWALGFLETNVRTYVQYQGRPGVYFFSLDANSRLAVCAARCRWGLPYYYAEMRMDHRENQICYQSRRHDSRASLLVRFRLGAQLGPSPPGTLEHFLLERYLLFVEHRGKLRVGQVHHSPYPAQRAEVLEMNDQLVHASGLPDPDQLPDLVHYASGVDVEIFSLNPV